jgi:hypothetical protein
MKKQFTLLLTLGLALLSFSLKSQNTNWVSISMDKHYANNGDVVAVPVRCYNLNLIQGMQYTHTWDSAQLKIVSVTPGALHTSAFSQANFNLSIPEKVTVLYEHLDFFSSLTLADSSILYTMTFLVLNNVDTARIFTTLTPLSPTVPAAIENIMGINLFNAEVNQPAIICPFTSSTQEPTQVSSVAVMPNPFYDYITLENTTSVTRQFELCAADGTVALRSTFAPGQNTYSTGHLPAGFYFWRIVGPYPLTGKLLKR